MSRIISGLAVLAGLVALAGCASTTPPDQPIETLSGPAPVRGSTRVDAALRCLAEKQPREIDLRLSVNDLTDGTGATLSGDSLSRVLTQRPDVMMTIGLAKTGVRLVNRSSTGVAEWELKHSMQKYIGDDRPTTNPETRQPVPYRPVMAGSMLGSTHYISGALSELNWNIQSEVNEAGIGGITFGSRSYRISMAVDLIVTRTRSTEIVIARSYSKQLVGRETGTGMFRFFDVGSSSPNWGPNELFELNIGRQANEPVQAAVRWMLETAAYDIVSELTGVGEYCDHLLPEGSRPLRAARPAPRLAQAPEPTPAPAAPSRSAAPPAVVPPVAVATKPSASPSPANGITGVNLIDDDQAVVMRIDTVSELAKLPVVEALSPLRLTIEFDSVANAVGKLRRLALAGVRNVTLESSGKGSRVVVDLAQPHNYQLSQQGRSVLVSLTPVTAGEAETLSAEEAERRLNGSQGVVSADVLAPHTLPADPVTEALIQRRRR